MEFFETACENKVSKEVTKIRVYLTPEARRLVESKKRESKEWIDRCFWRFVWEQHQAERVNGAKVEFTLDEVAATRLLADLEKIDLENAKRN